MNERMKIRSQLTAVLENMGYPADFAGAVADHLRTEKAMKRMIGYLRQADPARPEDIADEMLAIMEDMERWKRKKIAEYNNRKYNELLASGLDEDE